VVLRFRDPAERHLRGEAAEAARAVKATEPAPAPEPEPRPRPASKQEVEGEVEAAVIDDAAVPGRWIIVVALAIAAVALAGLIWVLAS
jgi:hypothetical protein